MVDGIRNVWVFQYKMAMIDDTTQLQMVLSLHWNCPELSCKRSELHGLTQFNSIIPILQMQPHALIHECMATYSEPGW